MPQAFYILFGAVFTCLVSVASGRLLLQKLGVRLYKQEELPFALLCGSALLSLLVFLLAAAQLLYKGVLLAAGAAILLLAWKRRAFRSEAPSLSPLPRGLLWIYTPLALLFGVFAFVHAMAPETSPDGTTYHLGLVARYYRERGFSFLTTHMYANLTQGIEMLFLYAYAFGRHSAAALVHFCFLLALPLLMVNHARRNRFGPAGLGAAFLVGMSPVVTLDGASAYNDVAVAAVMFGVFALAGIWDETRSNRLLPVLGLLAGFSFGSKYTAFPALLYALGFLFWRRRGAAWRPALTVLAAATVMIAPWLIKNSIVVANPVSPFFNRVFENPYVNVSFEQEYSQSMRNYPGLKSHWEIPLEVTIRGHVLNGVLGPVFLLAPLSALALRSSAGRRLVAAGICFGAVYAANIGTRFLIPSLPYVALAMALVFSRLRGVLPVIVLVHAISAWPPVLKKYCAPYAWRLDEFRLRAALRLEPEADFLSRKWPSYAVARMIEHSMPPDASVLTFIQTGEAYTARNIVVAYQSAFGNELGGILWTPLVPDYQPVRRVEFAFPRQPLLGIRLRQTSAGTPDHWTVNEVRLGDAGKELPRAPDWRLRAWPNPWGVQSAFDNACVTRWSSWRPANPDMFISVEFPAPRNVESVVVETSTDVAATRMELDGLTAPEQWLRLVIQPKETQLPPPLGLRREATQLIKEKGIGYLLVHENDLGSADFAQKQDLWGIALVGESHGYRLYRIQ